jgi:hypothetical protein
MTGLKKILFDAFKLIIANPLLFLPKLIIAFLYSIPMLFLPELTFALLELTSNPVLLISLIFWIFIIFLISILDILFNSMYSFTVKDYLNKKNISLIHGIKNSLKNFKKIFISIITANIIFIIIAFIVSIPLSYFILINSTALTLLFFVFYALTVFILFIAFYLIYPIASLEKFNEINSLKQSILLAKKNFKKISIISIISFFLSFFSILIPFIMELMIQSNAGLIFIPLIAFILIRFLTAVISTYCYILNPVFYLEAELK